ncbi:hypothetical protein KP509_05G002300 [Ceratopteris richardii]|uniref:Protein YIP n=1 Tax=Ceratopteris richardii TaxID=49495 RepID=A0A8T2UIZ6_CERRI|nr:hypothetical protein KP509_05G002300 [Ceratopteris richardii]
MSHSDTVPLNASSQSDIDEIENLLVMHQQHDQYGPSPMQYPGSVPAARPSSPPRASIPVSTSISVPPALPTPKTPAPAGPLPKPSMESSSVPDYGARKAPTGFGGGPSANTLTEPVWFTIKRDLTRVGTNLRHVVFPNPYREDPGQALRDWDLWGPFFFIVFLGVAISYSASSDNSRVFAVVFAVLAAGAVILTLNVLLLGGHIIFFQSLSLLGYCLFPLDIGALICMFKSHSIVNGIVVLITLAWSSWAAYPFVSAAVSSNRKTLAVYPVFLLYVSIGFFIFAV